VFKFAVLIQDRKYPIMLQGIDIIFIIDDQEFPKCSKNPIKPGDGWIIMELSGPFCHIFL
jgi:hypothetical protein